MNIIIVETKIIINGKGRYALINFNSSKKNLCEELEKNGFSCAVTAPLYRDRTPLAYADIFGEYERTRGIANFFYTPLGILVNVSMKGLDKEIRVYGLSFISKEGARWRLPPLYNKNGCAWCSALTGKISVCELLGGEIIIESGTDGEEVALGEIICPFVRRIG